MNKQRLVAFLYMIMRDELSTGKIVEVINKLDPKDGYSPDGYKFTNKHLEAMSVDYADRIVGVE